MSWREKIKSLLQNLRYVKQERGAIFVLTALLLPVLFGFLGLGYDVGNLYMHKARLQNTADAAALAGARGYVNKLSENALNGYATNATTAQKDDAKTQLKVEAERYIRENSPLFVNKTGRKEEFAFGTRTISKDETTKKTNTVEYFRVILREPVNLHFLPVIGIKNSAEVSVYATAKLSDTETTEGSGSLTPVDAENKPVVIAGSNFYDVTNHTSVPTVENDPNHEHDDERNYYNVSTVYVAPGATIKANKDKNGKNIVYTNTDGIGSADVVEADYNFMALATEIKKIFKNKQQKLKNDIANSTETEIKAKLKTEYDKELITYNSLKTQYDNEKSEYDRVQAEYEQAYQTWQAAYGYATRLEEIQAIWDAGVGKYVKDSNYKTHWNVDTAYEAIKQMWLNDGKPFTQSEEVFSKVFKNKDNLYAMYDKPQFDWQANQYEGLWMGEPPPETPTITAPVAPVAPKSVDERYEKLMSHINDEYYMTYHGDRIDPFKSSVISADTSLSGSEHSYFYLSWKAAGYNAPQTSVLIDGFYVNPAEGITTDTPFYLFIENDVDLVNFEIKNTNRPLVLCYLGSSSVHYAFQSGTSINNRNIYRGFIYAPSASGDTHINGNYIDFRGSIVSEKLDIHSQYSVYKYDVEEINKWKKAGLPVTPNIGFVSSSGSTGGETTKPSEKITILDRIRLYLAGSKNDTNYYKNSDIVWTDITSS